MIAETREKTEVGNYPEDCIQFLETYLRSISNYNTMQNKEVYKAIKSRLYMTVKDYAIKRKLSIPDDSAEAIVNEAINRFMHNWKNKKEGTDDRGHRLGKSW